MTNGDYLRSLKDEDLIDYLMSSCPEEPNCAKYARKGGGCDCDRCWLDWLKQEAEE